MEEEKLRAVRALAASVAHEIRNPLGAIQNSVAVLKRDLPLEGDDRTLMAIVFEEAERIGAIVSQFLSFARPSEPVLAPGDVGELLREVATLAEKDERAQAGSQTSGSEARCTELLLRVDPDLPTVAFDEDKIKQVVWNLISNALDAARSGHVAIRARRAPDGGVEVRVADDGPGIAPEMLARAFEPFRTTKARGTGLGLTISKSIVDAHGGTIRIESAVGSGTTVSFTIPPLSLKSDEERK
jgi:signal transduction histidine kinase